MLFKLYLSAFATYILSAQVADADGLYTKASPVIQVTGKSYEKLVAKSNSVTVSSRKFSSHAFSTEYPES